MKNIQIIIEDYCVRNIDKVLHFIAGLLLSLPIFLWTGFLVLPILVGLGKELYDKYVSRSKFDIYDFYATIAGTVPVILIYLIKFLL